MALSNQSRSWRAAIRAATGAAGVFLSCAAFAADIAVEKSEASSPAKSSPASWTGVYLGGHIGYAWGTSNWAASTAAAPAQAFASGSLNLAQPIDNFKESGSFFEGVQIGYNYKLQNNFVVGAEADATFPVYPEPLTGRTIGGVTTLASPLGPESYLDTVLASGTFRGRIGYAPGRWLLYAAGGAAWTYDQRTLTQLATGLSEDKNQVRWGWAAGAGIEAPLIPHWTARLEYLYTDYGNSSVTFPAAGQRFASDFSVQEVRLGLNYQLGADARLSEKDPKTPEKAEFGYHQLPCPVHGRLAGLSVHSLPL